MASNEKEELLLSANWEASAISPLHTNAPIIRPTEETNNLLRSNSPHFPPAFKPITLLDNSLCNVMYPHRERIKIKTLKANQKSEEEGSHLFGRVIEQQTRSSCISENQIEKI